MASVGDLFDGMIIGLHLVSAHSAPGLNDANGGVYLRAESGITAGVYENSISGTKLNGNDGRRRTSMYLGWTWETPGQAWAVTLGAVNGYGSDEQRTCRPDTAPPMGKTQITAQAAVTATSGCSNYTHQPAVRDILPLAVFSGRLPITSGWAMRLAYMYVPAAVQSERRLHVGHLMSEYRY
jgi:hypothetical protein